MEIKLFIAKKDKTKDKTKVSRKMESFLRDFLCLQMILKDRAWAPGVLLDVHFFNSFFHTLY